ncbi:hypothetical protein [Blastococcus sp. PRF04-17]|uniref:hypothetical protein n=1 Tax=Blastococcus sp. PRF04-17 TaxID=2933797 RepID=UPI001FF2A9DB|nr:hypothetical protein [Blastococcus sp. PRF04-17]UOY03627.1 hypothetical protein MVA48_09980 [Blastococcus sp. PRF04-17]
MTEEQTWRPLGVDTDEEIAEYDALHDGVPGWMANAMWAWVRQGITVRRSYRDGSGSVAMLDSALAERMCQTLRIPLPTLRAVEVSLDMGNRHLTAAMAALQEHPHPLQIVDYLLAHGGHAKAEELAEVLRHSRSAWEVGERAGRPGLTRRVPAGVQVAADSVMQRAGRAGTRLAKAWEALYGIESNPSAAYRLAILAVEDAGVAVVSPKNEKATLGTVLRDIEQQGDWRLPMAREHEGAPSREVLVGMMRLLWHGQHDRHGGQPSSPGDVSFEEASVAVSLAITLVQWFATGLLSRDR